MKGITSLLVFIVGLASPAFGEGHDAGKRPALQAERETAEPKLTQITPEIEGALKDLRQRADAYAASSAPKKQLSKTKDNIRASLDALRSRIVSKIDCSEVLTAAEKALVDQYNRIVMSAVKKTANIDRTLWFDGKLPLMAQEELYHQLIFYPDITVDALTLPSQNGVLYFKRFAYPTTAIFNPGACNIERHGIMFGEGGVALAYNPRTKRVESKQDYWGGIAGVYNPVVGRVEWKKKYAGGVSGAFNPARGIVEWNTAYASGSTSVYDPFTRSVEHRKNFSGGINSVFNPKTRMVEYAEAFESGVALVSLRAGALTTSNAGYAANEDDDDD